MFQLLQQSRTAALGGTATIGLNGNQNNRLARSQSTHTVKHQHAACLMVTLQLQSDGGDPLLAEAWVVLQFQGLQGQTIHSRATHAADELGAGSCITAPAVQLRPRIERSGVDFNTTTRGELIHRFDLNHR